MSPSDLLVRRAAEGDRNAFGELVETHWPALVSVARSVVGDGEAEDAVQESLLAAWAKLGSLRDPKAFPSWITRVVVRRCMKRARRRRDDGWVSLDEAPEPSGAAPDPEEAEVGRLLARLAPRQRAVVHLTAVGGLTDREIGRRMGITAASVRSHRRRARESLARILDGDPR